MDATRVGVTGMSLGGLASWYAAAVDSADIFSACAPVCGGLGCNAINIQRGNPDRASNAMFPPFLLRHFDHDTSEIGHFTVLSLPLQNQPVAGDTVC